jgi:hypothetical protein
MPDLHDSIHDYLESFGSFGVISAKGLDELVYKIHAYTGVGYDVAREIVRLFFTEIRSGILRGDTVMLAQFGKFYPALFPLSNGKKSLFPRFKAYTELSNRVSDK